VVEVPLNLLVIEVYQFDHIFNITTSKKTFIKMDNLSKIPFYAKYSFMDHKAQGEPLERHRLRYQISNYLRLMSTSRCPEAKETIQLEPLRDFDDTAMDFWRSCDNYEIPVNLVKQG